MGYTLCFNKVVFKKPPKGLFHLEVLHYKPWSHVEFIFAYTMK